MVENVSLAENASSAESAGLPETISLSAAHRAELKKYVDRINVLLEKYALKLFKKIDNAKLTIFYLSPENKVLSRSFVASDLEAGGIGCDDINGCKIKCGDNECGDDECGDVKYFRLEYPSENPTRRVDLFHRNLDTVTWNIHVVPGIFRIYERGEPIRVDARTIQTIEKGWMPGIDEEMYYTIVNMLKADGFSDCVKMIPEAGTAPFIPEVKTCFDEIKKINNSHRSVAVADEAKITRSTFHTFLNSINWFYEEELCAEQGVDVDALRNDSGNILVKLKDGATCANDASGANHVDSATNSTPRKFLTDCKSLKKFLAENGDVQHKEIMTCCYYNVFHSDDEADLFTFYMQWQRFVARLGEGNQESFVINRAHEYRYPKG